MSRTIFASGVLPARQTATASTVTGSAIDLQLYDGKAYIIIDCTQATAGTSPTATFTITECDTSGGVYTAVTLPTTPTVVTDAAGGGTQMIEFDVADTQRYIKGVCVVGGSATPTFQYSMQLVGYKQYQA